MVEVHQYKNDCSHVSFRLQKPTIVSKLFLFCQSGIITAILYIHFDVVFWPNWELHDVKFRLIELRASIATREVRNFVHLPLTRSISHTTLIDTGWGTQTVSIPHRTRRHVRMVVQLMKMYLFPVIQLVGWIKCLIRFQTTDDNARLIMDIPHGRTGQDPTIYVQTDWVGNDWYRSLDWNSDTKL